MWVSLARQERGYVASVWLLTASITYRRGPIHTNKKQWLPFWSWQAVAPATKGINLLVLGLGPSLSKGIARLTECAWAPCSYAGHQLAGVGACPSVQRDCTLTRVCLGYGRRAKRLECELQPGMSKQEQTLATQAYKTSVTHITLTQRPQRKIGNEQK